MNNNVLEKPIGFLRFHPIFRPVRWGGTRLGTFKGLATLPFDNVGESWELSGLANHETVIAEGLFKGNTITELLSLYGERIMGEKLYDRYGKFFPLLIKFIDAEDDLSIQVHPDDAGAPDGRGKTELWYIIKAEPGSYIYSGFNRPLTREALKAIMHGNRLVDVLAKHFAVSGDVFYVPAGRIHSIGAGNLLLEIQQTSGVTYRLHDYDRLDKDGRKRELHIEKAFDHIDYEQTDFELAHPQMLIGCETRVKRTPYFTVTAIQVMDTARIQVSEKDSPRILIAVEGSGRVTDNFGNVTEIRRGQTVLVPFETESIDIQALSTPLKLITVYIE